MVKKLTLISSMCLMISTTFVFGQDPNKLSVDQSATNQMLERRKKTQIVNNTPAVNPANFDLKTSPKDDFYQFVNGNWLKNNPIPASESRWGAFSEIQENNFSILRSILEESSMRASSAPKGSTTQMVGDMYYTGMDSLKREKEGSTPMISDINQVNSITNLVDLQKLVATMHMNIGAPLFNFYAYSDPKNSESVVPQAMQGGLGMPDKDYYLKDDDKSKMLREKYKQFITNCFENALGDKARGVKMSDKIINIETQMARASLSRVERRDPEKTYNKMTVAQMDEMMPNFKWSTFLKEVNAQNVEYMIIDNPKFFKQLNSMLTEVSLEDWKEYLTWNIIRSGAPYLNYALVNESYVFYQQTLQGTKEMKPRWKIVLQTVDGNLGQLLGQEYCNRVFTAETKAKCLEMVNNLATSYSQRLDALDWMSPETKKMAKFKLASFMKKIGFPDKYRDYGKLEITRASFYENVKRTSNFDFAFNMSKIGKPVDKTEWMMSPPTVNAYYNPSFNEIVFPAGILQPPFYNSNADDAVNYGGIGAVIGHEMTHGFDDEGRKFDANGNLTNWWQADDSARFVAKAHMLVEQFNKYTVLDTAHVNGELTLGENIADLGGITISYYAFQNSLKGKPAPEKIDGYNAEQRFFIGWAQVWRNNTRDAATLQRLMIDPHSPGIYRCNSPLSNFDEFYKAFDIKPGDKMYRSPETRAKIW